MINFLKYSTRTEYDELLDNEQVEKGVGPTYSITLTGYRPGMQGVDGNHLLFDFDQGGVLVFKMLIGNTTLDLDTNIESVVDTGYSLIFQFIGGGTVTIDGLSGYEDFTSLSMDYPILVNF